MSEIHSTPGHAPDSPRPAAPPTPQRTPSSPRTYKLLATISGIMGAAGLMLISMALTDQFTNGLQYDMVGGVGELLMTLMALLLGLSLIGAIFWIWTCVLLWQYIKQRRNSQSTHSPQPPSENR